MKKVHPRLTAKMDKIKKVTKMYKKKIAIRLQCQALRQSNAHSISLIQH